MVSTRKLLRLDAVSPKYGTPLSKRLRSADFSAPVSHRTYSPIGVDYLVIRPFQLGDLLLVQRLGGQATKLNAIKALLQPRTASVTSLSAIIPRFGARTNTFVLRQNRNSLAKSGFIQIQERTGRPEADITLLAPALDTPRGHPAIWEKLLAYYIQQAAVRSIERVYADVPDQPLPVNTFTQRGFRTYTSQTIWRLTPENYPQIARTTPTTSAIQIRPQTPADIWALKRLYAKVTPKSVQRAEGFEQGPMPNGSSRSENSFEKSLRLASLNQRVNGTNSVKLLMLDWWHSSQYGVSVLTEKDEINGCILVGQGQRGIWLRLLIDTLNPNTEHIHALLRHGLQIANRNAAYLPIYIGVRDYHGGMGSILKEYDFAPFTDQARMVRKVPVWARTAVPVHEEILDAVGKAVPTTFALPKPNMTQRRVKD